MTVALYVITVLTTASALCGHQGVLPGLLPRRRR
jgi:hypothetical protein